MSTLTSVPSVGSDPNLSVKGSAIPDAVSKVDSEQDDTSEADPIRDADYYKAQGFVRQGDFWIRPLSLDSVIGPSGEEGKSQGSPLLSLHEMLMELELDEPASAQET